MKQDVANAQDLINQQLKLKKKDKNEGEEVLKVVSFKLGNEEFALDIVMVREIIKMLQITRVPKAPNYVEGVINLRGRVVPVINIRKRLGLELKEYDKDTKITVVDIGKKTVGFIVDSVSEVLKIPKSTIEPAPSILGEVDTEFITGVGRIGERLLSLLNIEKVLFV